ncbi:uncharacterized protein C2orf50 homolog [Lampris incognitus]|uniref:uncharacterized protein C2orf50 homolog n=1 Tax=Lampris incognitus TaxID=2546036 RepID=UPI0024B6330D|nr:uncharacterized protein C2orf50 homolog [Lampris incognitus]
MELTRARRVSSAGYRLPERPGPAPQRAASAQDVPEKTRNGRREDGPRRHADSSDAVKRDQLWRDFVRTEMRGVREWEKNWGFLKQYDQMGQLKPETPLPSPVLLFSDCLPKTTNQTFGSRVSTPLGRELMRMDRLLLSNPSHHKCKKDPETLPC